MDHPQGYVGDETLKSSINSCASHKINWEASINGKITTESNAGSLPIEDVSAMYQLLNKSLVPIDCSGCSGITKTTKGGSFDITFNIDHKDLYEDNEGEYPVNIYFNKTTPSVPKTIEHKFSCNQGKDDCSGEIGTLVYLSHLKFKEPLH
eukprot:4565877-Ditylum_brightwellii.AAC.1